ncbi:MAG: hypothetical protein DMG40_02990 [Acidobacteria bacterium]|nr:MAG: hypothetical protein DMG40_02990 [Acidobacteriota bacterium]
MSHCGFLLPVGESLPQRRKDVADSLSHFLAQVDWPRVLNETASVSKQATGFALFMQVLQANLFACKFLAGSNLRPTGNG